MPKRTGGPAVDPLSQSVTSLPGVGPAVAGKLAARGLVLVQDLWFHLPIRYEDRTRIAPIASLAPGRRRRSSGACSRSSAASGTGRRCASRSATTRAAR
jgi:RecG-like helicase